ncbi:hypothetical protein Clacol_007274 [Clathrus columnatus]|uniref:polynucleotide adenylyltransferase n=1 Tax=Clathrus columnatus TaxID=1419009 RepID=A0AAV5AJI0_9AGAM|nr:hypothetical protein Clacol_007274 [Clathrus columnatus]
MRLAGRRWLSLSFAPSRQALFSPYLEPMNKEQEKNLRKLLLRNEPRLHPRIHHDVNRLLQLHSPRPRKLKSRAESIAWLNELISTTFGKQFSVKDVSLNQYACDIDYAPLELAIVDSSRTDGFPPGTEDESRIGPYDPMLILVKLLEKHGLTGTLMDGDAFNLIDPDLISNMTDIEDLGPVPTYPPWSEPNFIPVPYIRYPAILQCDGNKFLIPFHLSPPMPTLIPLQKLLKRYLQNDVYKNLVTFIYLWVRSIGLESLSPTCVALMVIVFLQAKKNFPVLQQFQDQSLEELKKRDKGVWVVADFLPRHGSRSFYVETPFFEKEFHRDMEVKKIKPFVYGFMDFWATHNPKSEFIATEQIFSIRTGNFSPRESSGIRDPAAKRVIQQTLSKIQAGLLPWSPLEPPVTWRRQHIVVEDPFIPSFNHARTLSPHASRFFHNAAAVSRRTLHHGHSVHNILGPALQDYGRQYSTAAFTQEIKDSYRSLAPPRSVFDRRKLTISRIEKVIRKEFGSHFHVLNFGSTRYGVSTASSDLDLVIMLYTLLGMWEMLWLPIDSPTCRDPVTGINCDININDRMGLINTFLMENYCRIAPDIRPMCLTVKRWAKYCGLNDSAGLNGPRTFSSYSLVLMTRGILPNIQEGFPPLPSNPRRGVFYVRQKKKTIRCDTRFRETELNTPPIEFDVGEALLGWFEFWGKEFDYDRQLLSVRHGGLVERTLKDKIKNEKQLKKERRQEKANAIAQEESVIPKMDAELTAEDDDAVAAWNEQREELEENERKQELEEDEEDEGLPSDLEESEDETLSETPETVEAVEAVSKSHAIKSWNGPFVVTDPFLLDKNLTSQFGRPKLKQFRSECCAALQLIKSGGTLKDIIPTDPDVEDDDDSSSTNSKEDKKSRKRNKRLGIPIKPSGTPKDISKIVIDSQSQGRKSGKKRNDNRPSRPSSPASTIPATQTSDPTDQQELTQS